MDCTKERSVPKGNHRKWVCALTRWWHWSTRLKRKERESRERERAEERAKGKGAKGGEGAEAKGKAEEWLAENPNRRCRSAEALQRKAREPRAKDPDRKEKGSP